MNTSTKATIALFGTIFLWAFMAVVAKNLVEEISPVIVLFYRLFIAAVCFLPFFLKNRIWEKPHFANLFFISLGSTVNLTLFTLGIKYTSASVSQLLYAAMPILILLHGKFFKNEIPSLRKTIGVMVGFSGLMLIGYRSAIEKGETITGSLQGNLMIFVAMIGWTAYLLNSKKISKYFTPIEMGSTSILVSFFAAFLILVFSGESSTGNLMLSGNQIYSVLYIGFAGTFITYILYQYAIKHSSPLKVSFAAYIQPLITTILAMFFLGERLTSYFIIGSIMILSGVFLASSLRINFKK